VTRRLLLLLLALQLSGAAKAHEMSMAELDVRETMPGAFIWQWGAGEKRPAGDELTMRWPEGCRAEGNAVRCGAGGLDGEIAVEGVGKRFSAALVKVSWLDGSNRVCTLTAAQTSVTLHGGAEDRRGAAAVAKAYVVLGVEHILGGFDHLLFVLCLLFLVGFERRLVWTITAFTAAHSVTLASAALGWLTLRPPPVEACIALSIVLVAAEALHTRRTLARRWPALVAFGFGLVHGLGFAGALQQIGLPSNHLALALLTFNVGVEAGQLLVVGAAWAVARGLRHWPRLQPARVVVLYAAGALAAFWSIERIAAIVA
jgi:hydrogenase/urease accessory protein HupE